MKLPRIYQQRGVMVAGVVILTISLVSGSAFAYNKFIAPDPVVKSIPQSAEQPSNPAPATTQPADVELSDNTQADEQPAQAPNTEPAAADVAAPKASDRAVAVICNQEMKNSFANQYQSEVASEKSRWARQLDGITNRAGNGVANLNVATEKLIEQAKPAHEANLAAAEARYNLSLRSIHCQE